MAVQAEAAAAAGPARDRGPVLTAVATVTRAVTVAAGCQTKVVNNNQQLTTKVVNNNQLFCTSVEALAYMN